MGGIFLKKEAAGGQGAPLGLPFSPGIRVGDLLFISGQGPIDRTGKVVTGDIRVQTKLTLENFRRIVEEGSSSMENVVQTTVYLRDLDDYAGMNEVYARFFPEPRPSRATVQAQLLFGMLVEIVGVAHVPGNQSPEFRVPGL